MMRKLLPYLILIVLFSVAVVYYFVMLAREAASAEEYRWGDYGPRYVISVPRVFDENGKPSDDLRIASIIKHWRTDREFQQEAMLVIRSNVYGVHELKVFRGDVPQDPVTSRGIFRKSLGNVTSAPYTSEPIKVQGATYAVVRTFSRTTRNRSETHRTWVVGEIPWLDEEQNNREFGVSEEEFDVDVIDWTAR